MKAVYKLLLPLLAIALATGSLAGCASGGKPKTLAVADVQLSSDPASPLAGKEAKLIVTVNNPAYAKREAEVQLQINSNDTLPQLIDTVREDDKYSATYAFPKAGSYIITVHMSYEEEHYAYAKPLDVGE